MATGRKTRGIVEVPESLDDREGVMALLRDLHRSVRDVQAGRVGVGETTVVESGGGTPGPSGPPGPPGAPAPGTEPDLTPPPTPSNLTAVAGISNIIIEWDVAVYSQGHGNLQTNIYGAKYPGTGPDPTFGDAVLVGSAPQPDALFVLATDPSTQWHLWAKFQSRDGVESVSPAGGANGVVVTTGQDVTLLLDALTGSITESQLFSTLGARIDLIDGIGVGSVNARIATETAARTSADNAISASITTLQASVGSNTAAIAAESIARANADGSLFAQYTVKVDLNGYVSGYGLASTSSGAAPTSSFIVRADRFAVSSPSGPGITPATPFIVNTTPLTENGVTIPPGVYIDGAYIRNLTAGIARLGDAWIDDAKVGSVSAGKLTTGSLNVGALIQSSDYIAGVSGWRINGSGSAEFAAASIRGQITAAQINSNGLSIKTAGGVTILDANTPLTASYIGASIGGGNLVRNSSFELDSNGDGVPDYWTNTSIGSGLSLNRTIIGSAVHGTFGLRIQITSITSPSGNVHNIFYSIAGAPSVIAGVPHTISAWVNGSTTDYRANFGVQWLDAADSVLDTTFVIGTLTATGQWQRFTVTGIPPAGAVKARPFVGIRRPSAGDTTLGHIIYDAFQLEQGDVATAYAPSDIDSVNFANKISAANIALFMESAAITDAYIGTLNAAKIIAGTITTDKIQVGAASVASSTSTGAVLNTFTSSSNWQTPITTVTSLAVSGAPVKIIGVAEVDFVCDSASCSAVTLSVSLLVNSAVLKAFGMTVPTAGASSRGGGAQRQAIASVPIAWRHTPAASTRTYQFRVLATPLDSTGAPLSASGEIFSSATLVVEENKV